MALTPREAAPGHSNTRNLPSLQPRGVWDTAIPVYTVTYSEAWLMNRAGSCAADYICVYNAIQCTRSDWERAKQESDSPSLASAETSSTGNGDQRSFCRVLLRTEANPPHTVGEGPGQQEVPLGAAYRVTVCSPAWEPRPRRKHQRPGERQTSLQPEHASQNRPLRAGGTRAPPLEVRGLHAGQGGLVGSGCLLSPRAQH